MRWKCNPRERAGLQGKAVLPSSGISGAARGTGYAPVRKRSTGGSPCHVSGALKRVFAAPHEPLSINGFNLLSGKSVAGWPSGSAIDSEDTMSFSALTGVRARIEKFKLEDAEQAYAKVMQNKVRFRAVLVP